MPLDFAIVPRWRRSVLVVWCALLNAILEHGCFSIARIDNSAWQRHCKQPAKKLRKNVVLSLDSGCP
jgi:hypothetical protein